MRLQILSRWPGAVRRIVRWEKYIVVELRDVWISVLEDCSVRLRLRVLIILVLVVVIHVGCTIHVVVAGIRVHRHAIAIIGHLLGGNDMRGLRLRVHWGSLARLLIGHMLVLRHLVVLGWHEVRALNHVHRGCHA